MLPASYREDCTLVCVRIASSSTAAKVVCEEDMNAFILELLPNLLLMHKNWETPLKMTTLLAESSLTTSHPLLKGLNELVLCDGEFCVSVLVRTYEMTVRVWCVSVRVWCVAVRVWCVAVRVWCVAVRVWCVAVRV